ncbi:hypothetical protein OG949_39960 [Streptomyces scopuliridis]|nr:hypothetical protein [Streptomyces scopuliridis]WSB38380.1 hypothetical protein OG949_39960 [Streptomyces scopuliridis]
MLELVRGSFTAPSFRTFAALVTGLIAQTGWGTVGPGCSPVRG